MFVHGQLLHGHLNHIGLWNSSNRSPLKDMAAGSQEFFGAAGEDKEAHEHDEELLRVPRSFASRKSTVYSIFWYAVAPFLIYRARY